MASEIRGELAHRISTSSSAVVSLKSGALAAALRSSSLSSIKKLGRGLPTFLLPFSSTTSAFLADGRKCSGSESETCVGERSRRAGVESGVALGGVGKSLSASAFLVGVDGSWEGVGGTGSVALVVGGRGERAAAVAVARGLLGVGAGSLEPVAVLVLCFGAARRGVGVGFGVWRVGVGAGVDGAGRVRVKRARRSSIEGNSSSSRLLSDGESGMRVCGTPLSDCIACAGSGRASAPRAAELQSTRKSRCRSG